MSPEPTNGQHGHEESARAHARAARTHAHEAGAHAAAAAEEMRDAAEEAAQEIRDRVAAIAGEFRDRANTWRSQAENYVRENPAKSILTAVGVGFVLGALFRR
jgi:ElaB/YqjD/DUF883 family membrane-anchored ribosome-binding protein